jgi:AcrR family transcriptional regulator
VQAAAEQAQREARQARAEAQQARRDAQRAQREAQKAQQEADRAAQKLAREQAKQQATDERAAQALRRTAQVVDTVAAVDRRTKTGARAAAKGAKGGPGTDAEPHVPVIRRAVAKVDGALTEGAVKADRHAQKSAKRADLLDNIAGHLSVLDIWTREEPAGRRPRFTREEIAAAAVRIADQEGFSAVSMRHLAAEMGAGTMTLYHYVRTKDELLTLVVDAVMGEVVIPADEPLPENWRAAMTVIAHRSRDSLQRHPWILDITDDPPFGPNSVRHFDQTLAAVSSLDIPLIEKFDIVTCVDEYVFGHCLHQRNNVSVDDDILSAEVADYVESLVRSGGYPQLEALVEQHSLDEVWEQIYAHQRDDARFDRNLQRLLDGIEAGLPPGAVPGY